MISFQSSRFQSTLLMRGETMMRIIISMIVLFQSTLLMRGETSRSGTRAPSLTFQSTLLMRGETIKELSIIRRNRISIHSPHARRDWMISARSISRSHFNPLSSCEERLFPDVRIHKLQISIHSPHARRDESTAKTNQESAISIHSPHARRDALRQDVAKGTKYFNPLSSCEERRRYY